MCKRLPRSHRHPNCALLAFSRRWHAEGAALPALGSLQNSLSKVLREDQRPLSVVIAFMLICAGDTLEVLSYERLLPLKTEQAALGSCTQTERETPSRPVPTVIFVTPMRVRMCRRHAGGARIQAAAALKGREGRGG